MKTMFSDKAGLEALSDGESLEMLASTTIGRVAYSARAMPFVVPVNFVLDGMDIVIRTSRRSGLAANVAGNIVAFEADDLDGDGAFGWSVVVTGLAELVEDAAEIERLDMLRLRSWAPASTDCYVRLRADVVSGRRFAVVDATAS